MDNGKNIENTINSFRAAKKFGHNMIELDVQFSKDHVVMVYHDEELNRLSNVDKYVKELTSEELKKYSIPTLQDVLLDEKIPQFVNVEIKASSNEDIGLETALMKVLKETHSTERVIISSFNETALERMAVLAPNIERDYLVEKSSDETNDDFMARLKKSLQQAKTNVVHIYYGALTESLASLLKQNGITFRVWTVDDRQDARNMLNLGAIGIITNRVDLY
ncbi:MAG: glycerophosphodiester phosphodiesterase [Pseudobdellovibrionaceae bacterium]